MKIVNLFKSALFILLFLPFSNIFSKTIYVATDGDGTDGSTWSTAYTNIQAAIDAASSGDEIWVKEGVYYADPAAPDVVENVDRTLSINLASGVKLYGGFTADEVTVDDRPMIDLDGDGIIEAWEFSSPSVISGEIQNDGDITNNTQHILIVPSGVDATTLVNGFTIEDGYSDATSTISGIGTFVFSSGINVGGGSLYGCVIQNCESNTAADGYGGGISAVNANIDGCFVDGCVVTAKVTYGGGIYLDASEMKGCHINNCGIVTSEIQGVVAGGGVYSNSAIVDSCIISGCSSDPGTSIKSYGGGIYSADSHVIDSKIFDNIIEGTAGNGGGVYAVNSTYINSLIFNNEASANAGGAYSLSSYFTNCVIANNKTTGTTSLGGGVYDYSGTTIYNTVIWGNQSAISSQVSGSDATINSCAVEGEQPGTNSITLSSSNSGSSEGVLYAEFINPTDFKGNANGDATKESELELADWNISLNSDLIEKGNNNGFYEASIGYDLDGDGLKNSTIDDFYDLANENRLFNYKADIGAYEIAFVELTLPDPIDMEYGKSLAEVVIEGGSAIDLRDGSVITGEYTFVDGATFPQFADGVSEDYDILFTPEDISSYIEFYDVLTITVTPKELFLSGLTADDKEYDGTKDVTFSGTAILDGIVGTDDVSLNESGIDAVFEDKNAGVDKNVVFSGFTLSGVDAGNYTLSANGAIATITAKPVTFTAVTANDKVYDGTVTATYTESPDVVGVIDGDDCAVDESAAKASFWIKNVGTDILVIYTGFGLSGADAGNYQLTSQPGSSKASISVLSLVVEGVSAADKEYDSTTDAVIEGTAVVSGIIDGDAVTLDLSSVVADFDTKNVGTSKTVTFSGYKLSGTDASNYSLSQPNTDVADITVKEIEVTGLSAQDKQYDGTINTTLSGTAAIPDAYAGDDVSLNTTSLLATFEDANVGINKVVSLSGISLSGIDQSNYSLIISDLFADITAVEIEVMAEDKTKDYNDSDPELTYVILSGALVGSDVFTGTLEREVGEKAGTYSINQGTLSLTSNYNISFTPGVFTIVRSLNIIEFSLVNNEVYLSETDQITLEATSTSGLTVTFASSDESVATVSGNTLNIHSFGEVTITASDQGDENFDAADDVSVNLKIAVKVIQKGSSMLLVSNIKNAFTSYQWYKDGVEISGATKQYYYTSDGLSGEYYCKLNGAFDSENWSGGTVAAVIDVYPSPALKGSTFTVEYNNIEEKLLRNSTMSIYSITGKLIKMVAEVNNVNQLQLDKPGIYIIKTEGEVQSVKKIIVQ